MFPPFTSSPTILSGTMTVAGTDARCARYAQRPKSARTLSNNRMIKIFIALLSFLFFASSADTPAAATLSLFCTFCEVSGFLSVRISSFSAFILNPFPDINPSNLSMQPPTLLFYDTPPPAVLSSSIYTIRPFLSQLHHISRIFAWRGGRGRTGIHYVHVLLLCR